MSDPIASLTGGPSAFWAFVRKYWLFAFAALLISGALLMRYRNTLATKFSGLPAGVKTWLKISGLLVPVGYAVFASQRAFAGVMHVAAASHGHGHGVAGVLLGFVSLLLGGLTLGMFFQADDPLDLEDSQNGRLITYTPAATAQDKSLFINVHRAMSPDGKKPLVATAIVIKVVTTVTQPGSGGSILYHDDLNRLVESISIESPILGTLLDKVTGQGTVLGSLVGFLGNGFNGNADQGVAAIAANASPIKVTKFFTFPIAMKYLKDPLATSQYLKSLDKTEIKIRIGATTCLAAVSTGCAVGGADSTVSGCVLYVPHTHFFKPRLSYFRLDTPASGSDGLVFQNFGDKGPRASVPVDHVDAIFQLSNLKGLPGNTTIDNITRIIGPDMGLDDVLGIELLVQSRLKAQQSGASGRPNFADGGPYAMPAAAAGGGMDLAQLLALPLLQPSTSMHLDGMKTQAAGAAIRLREEFGTTRTGSDAFLIHSVRDMSDLVVKQISNIYGTDISATPKRAQGATRRA